MKQETFTVHLSTPTRPKNLSAVKKWRYIERTHLYEANQQCVSASFDSNGHQLSGEIKGGGCCQESVMHFQG